MEQVSGRRTPDLSLISIELPSRTSLSLSRYSRLLNSNPLMATIELELDLELTSQADTEPSIIEYARSQGICVDYTTERLQFVHLEAPGIDGIDRDLYDTSDAVVTSATQALAKERLTINRDAALFLKSTYLLQEAPVLDALATDRRRWMLNLKLELPVLTSDYELDSLSFGSTTLPDFKKLQIPSEAIDEQNDEGFEWPTTYLDYPARCDTNFKAEKLSVSKNALVYLQNTLKDLWVQENNESILKRTLENKPVCEVVSLTTIGLNHAEKDYSTSHTTTTPTVSDIHPLRSIIT